MSSNRLSYDTCEYKQRLNESVGPLAYMLNPMRYENCNKCRMELGVIGGTGVSHIKGNLVDLETDLKNDVIKYSASGFRDFTRIASSDPTMWRDVFLNNSDAVLEMIQRFNEDLSDLQLSLIHI